MSRVLLAAGNDPSSTGAVGLRVGKRAAVELVGRANGGPVLFVLLRCC
jgi:hypothetical protein